GSVGDSTVTDASGRYKFSGLAAGAKYVLSPARGGYVFSPKSQIFDALSADQTADFTAMRLDGAIRVHAGGDAYTDSRGIFWAADYGSDGEKTWSTGGDIANTDTPALYQTERYGYPGLQYRFNVSNGRYQVRLKFAEISWSKPGERVFDILINGATVENKFDIVAAAGAPMRAIDRVYVVDADNGAITIELKAITDSPKVSAIEILPDNAGAVRVNVGGPDYLDPGERFWLGDANYTGPATYGVAAPISGTNMPLLYQTARFAPVGPLQYRFVVPNGWYMVRLRFAETYYTQEGQRVFDISVNNRNTAGFDIVAAAGGPNIAVNLERFFEVTDGQIQLRFTPKVDLPFVSAIEIASTSAGMPGRIGVFRKGEWYLDANGNGAWDGAAADRYIPRFGQDGDIPVVGDWDGTGQTRIGVFRKGEWYLDLNGNGMWDGPSVDLYMPHFGQAGDMPVAGGWDMSGISRIGVYHNGDWYLDYNGNGTWDGEAADWLIPQFGFPGDIPIMGGWGASGMWELGLFRAGTWLIDMNSDTTWDDGDLYVPQFGVAGDLPVAGDWDGSGVMRLGVFRNGAWFLDLNNNYSWDWNPPDGFIAQFGQAGDWPVVLPDPNPPPAPKAGTAAQSGSQSVRIGSMGAKVRPKPRPTR
ncbi:MAG: malectin domain-containing carbohydrate-binding protein, partial [Acidobacteria bacterium]|nr:malectin domain-containing carbohydrate-binding protein [Acidobacteriota bacterium]